MEGKEVTAYEDNSVKGNLIEKEPTAGTITKVKELPQFQAEEWTLSNGAKVIYRKADYEKDEVALAVTVPVVLLYIRISISSLRHPMPDNSLRTTVWEPTTKSHWASC